MITKSVVTGFLSGAVVGGVVALLFAPKKGKYLRAEIGKTAEDVNEYIHDAAVKTVDAVRGTIKKTPRAA